MTLHVATKQPNVLQCEQTYGLPGQKPYRLRGWQVITGKTEQKCRKCWH